MWPPGSIVSTRSRSCRPAIASNSGPRSTTVVLLAVYLLLSLGAYCALPSCAPHPTANTEVRSVQAILRDFINCVPLQGLRWHRDMPIQIQNLPIRGCIFIQTD